MVNENQSSGVIAVLTTTEDSKQAKVIIHALLESRLAACIQTQNIDSHYVWQNELCNSQEVLLTIKTLSSSYEDVEKTILRHHPYDVPQIVALPIKQGLSSYLDWVKANASG
jgi:periplasmic divalent cation tolerance protein